MKALLVFALLAVSVTAINRLQKLRARMTEEESGEWDIAEGISGAAVAMGKVEGHEQSVRDGYNALGANDKLVITNPTKKKGFFEALHTPTPMIMGLQYPDMPIGGAKVSALGDDLTKPDHVTAGTFGAFFKAGSTGARNTFVAQTHYGCLQFWHAMAPEPYVGGKYKTWTNQALSDLIKASTRRIWFVAVDHLKNNRLPMAEFHLGRILHTIGDSFAKGHTARGGSDNCGKILVFQEYNAQKGNEHHSTGDKPASNRDTFDCTVRKITGVLAKWANCVRGKGAVASCLYPVDAIDSTFDIDPAVAGNEAGGSLKEYAGATALNSGKKSTVNAGGKSFEVFFPPENGLAKVAGSSSVAAACPPF